MLVVLYFFDNHIEYCRTNLKLSLEQGNEFFAIIGEYPHTVLQTNKTELLHENPKPITYLAAAFWHVKNYNAPSPVPTPFFRKVQFILFQFECEFLAPGVCNSRV